jgi:Icc-related predicted phosphoesterase
VIAISQILILADIHGNKQAVSKLISNIKKEKWSIDLILIAGDLPETTPIGLMLHYILFHGNLSKTKYTKWVYKGRGRKMFINRQIKSVKTILSLLSSLEVPIVYTPGNVDSYEAQQVIKTWEHSEVYFLNAETAKFESIQIWGYGGSEFTPKRYSEPLCDMEFFPKDFSFQMKPLFSIQSESKSSTFNILLTHELPAFSCTTAKGKIIGGSGELTKLIKHLNPNLVVFGHYHEFPLIKRQNNITFINPGPLTRYHFAIVNIEENLNRITIKKMNPYIWDFKNIIYSNRFSQQYGTLSFTQF